jgi:hypothetical protein
MSLEIVRSVGRDNPTWLPTNLGRTCYAHTVEVVARLRAAGHSASLLCKMEGEGGYTPPGFTPRLVVGLDGKQYLISRVSHDAIWVDGFQYDTLGSANEYDRPIFRRTGDPNWSFDPNDGPQIVASAIWNQIPTAVYRAWNPPLPGVVSEPGPVPPPPPPAVRFPSYSEMGDDHFFRAAIGQPLFEDENLVGEAMNDGSSVWFSRGSHRMIESFFKFGNHAGAPEIVKDLRNQWRAILRAAYPDKAHLIPPV